MGNAVDQVSTRCVMEVPPAGEVFESASSSCMLPWHCGTERSRNLEEPGQQTGQILAGSGGYEWCPADVMGRGSTCTLVPADDDDAVVPLGEEEALTCAIPNVFLNVYDLNGTVAPLNRLAMDVLKVGGVVHVGVEIFGEEVSYGGNGVKLSIPRKNPNYLFRRSISMGKTGLSRRQVEVLIAQTWEEWRGREYDILARNCGNFADTFCKLLGVGGLPPWVTRLAATADAIRTPIVGAARYVRCDEVRPAGAEEAEESIFPNQPCEQMHAPPIMPTVDLFAGVEGAFGADRKPHVEQSKKSSLYAADVRWASGTWGSAKDPSVGASPISMQPVGDKCLCLPETPDEVSRTCSPERMQAACQSPEEQRGPVGTTQSPATKYLGNLSSYASMQEPDVVTNEKEAIKPDVNEAEVLECNAHNQCQASGVRV